MNMWIACGNRWHIVAMGSFRKFEKPIGVCGARALSSFARDRKPRKGIACLRCVKIIELHEERKKKVVFDQLKIYGGK